MAEFYYNIQSDSGRLRPEHSIHRWGVTYRGLMEGDRDPRAGHSLEQKLRDAGLHDIHTRLFQIPIGDWPTGETSLQFPVLVMSTTARL